MILKVEWDVSSIRVEQGWIGGKIHMDDLHKRITLHRNYRGKGRSLRFGKESVTRYGDREPISISPEAEKIGNCILQCYLFTR